MRGGEGERVDLRSTIFNRKTRKTSCSPVELWMATPPVLSCKRKRELIFNSKSRALFCISVFISPHTHKPVCMFVIL